MPSAKAIRELMARPLYHPEGYYFDARAADAAVGFFRYYLTHSKGRKAGQAFILARWQVTIIRDIFGWKRPDGTRQYSTVYIEVPRKNGKSTMFAGVALLCLTGDHEAGAEVYSVAGDRKQAGIVYRIAKRMVKQNRYLSSIIRMYGGDAPMGVKSMNVPGTDSVYEVLSSDASLAFGSNPSAIIFDELHVQPNKKLWDAIKSGQGAREQPLLAAITTAGVDRTSLCYEQHEYALELLSGGIVNPSYYPVIYAASLDDDWTDQRIWAMCNPNLGESLNIRFFQDQVTEAKHVPSAENAFKRWYLNIWTSQIDRWLSMDLWDMCDAGELTEEQLLGMRCYGGIDLSSTVDLTAFVLVFVVAEPIADAAEDEPQFNYRFYIKSYCWCPEETAEERTQKSNVPYLTWADQGHLYLTPGNVIDYARVRVKVLELAEKYDIAEIAIDRWNAHQIEQELKDEGITMVPYGQNYRDMSAPSKKLEVLLASRMLHTFNNPALRWMASNVAAETDALGNIRPSRKVSPEKIDSIVALIMAIGRAILKPKEAASVYKKRGMKSL